MGKSTIPPLPALLESEISCQHSGFYDEIYTNYWLAVQTKRKIFEGDTVIAEITTPRTIINLNVLL